MVRNATSFPQRFRFSISENCFILSTVTQDDSENPSSTPASPASAGFSTDRLPPNTSHTTDSSSDDGEEAAVDPQIIRDEPDEDAEEEEGEDLYNDNYMESVIHLLDPKSAVIFLFGCF